MCLIKQDSKYALGPKYARICQSSEYGRVFQYAGVTQYSKYSRIRLHRVLKISWVLIMPRF